MSGVRILVVACIVLLAVGCAPAAAPPSPVASPAATAPEANLAASAAGWEQIEAAARREGKVAVAGPPGSALRDALVIGFQRRYPDIQLDFIGSTGTVFVPKVQREREAGLYLTDLHIDGTGTFLTRLQPLKLVDPITPALAGPDIEPSKWKGGRLDFSDDAETYNVVFTNTKRKPFAYHPATLSPGDIKSFKEFLQPKWKGKIAMLDPRQPGGTTLISWYITEGLGAEFIRQLFTQQDVTITTDSRQLMEWIARGTYPIGIDASTTVAEEMKQSGVKIEMYDWDLLEEPGTLSAGFGSVSLMNRAPHPNAAMVYINWVLGKEAQEAYSRAGGQPTRRLDVPTNFLDPQLVPKPGGNYIEIYREQYLSHAVEARELAGSVIK
jgi:iron(III) transport system substrate-binding protein